MGSKRFVIQEHAGYGPTHWDLMLEVHGQENLATWQFYSNPLTSGSPLVGRKIQDHRPAYLQYAGPVSQGRGRVRPVDQGTYELLSCDRGRWVARLSGKVLKGTFRLAVTGDPDEFLFVRITCPNRLRKRPAKPAAE